MKKTIVVLSGGIDSVSVLYKVVKKIGAENTAAISFNYGQKHSKELLMAKKNCELLGVEQQEVDLSCLKDLMKSSLTTTEDIPEGHYEDENMKSTVVPNRNSVMANIAIAWAVSKDYDCIALGVHAGDHAIYPDCRPLFIKALSVMADVSNYDPIEIYAPYLYKNKIEIVADGLKNGVDYANTWTCYKGEEKACGKCGSCQERIASFYENNTQDPVKYKQSWEKCIDIIKDLDKNI